MSSATLGKIALGLTFPLVGIIYLYQRKIAMTFAEQSYYKEAIELIKGYKPAMEKLGEPVFAKKIDLSDAFNYQDDKEARAKIPLQGQKNSANVMIYATRQANIWNLDSMEIEYPNALKYKFYDSSLVKLPNQASTTTPTVQTTPNSKSAVK